MGKYISAVCLKSVQDYFVSFDSPTIDKNLLVSEINALFQQISQFQDGKLVNHDYLALLAEIIPAMLIDTDEETVLHKVVPYWQRLRGVILSSEKPIDEFYFELEMLMLWVLLTDSASDKKLLGGRIHKMRSVIRRYSNMPQMWLLLCQQSGEELTTAYTF